MEKKANDVDFTVLKQDPKYYDESFKIILVGDSAVGKTCLIWRGVKGIFKERYDVTIATEFSCFMCKINGKVVKMQVWDTCGQEAQRSIANIFYKGSHCAVLVYDITRSDTFKHLYSWLKDVRNGVRPDAKFFLVGNMLDREVDRQVVPDTAKEFVQSEGLSDFIETSAKLGNGVNELFEEIAKTLYLKKEVLPPSPINEHGGKLLDAKTGALKKKKGCC